MKKKATLSDIAHVLNLTKVSVSKALRDHPDISERTKEKVREVAALLGYQPNQIARSLTSSRSRTLGVVVPKIAHNFFAHVVEGIQTQAAKSGYDIVLKISQENQELEKKHLQSLVSMQVEGLLVSVSQETKDVRVYEWLREMQMPLVFFDRHLPGIGFNSVVIDDLEAARDGVVQLIEQGSSNVAYVGGNERVAIARNRRTGYQQALRNHGLQEDPEMMYEGGLDEQTGMEAFEVIRKRGILPDGVLAITYPVGLGFCRAMRMHDAELLEKIPVLVFGDSHMRLVAPYPRFYIHQPGYEIGERAVEWLVKEIDTGLQPSDHIDYMPTRFMEAVPLAPWAPGDL